MLGTNSRVEWKIIQIQNIPVSKGNSVLHSGGKINLDSVPSYLFKENHSEEKKGRQFKKFLPTHPYC